MSKRTFITVISGAALMLSGVAMAQGGPQGQTYTTALDCALVPPLPENGPLCNEITGHAELNVHSNKSFNVKFRASGLIPGHSVTLWAFDATFAGGFMAGGIVGGSGKVTLNGNSCIYVMAPDENGNIAPDVGFEPGGDRRCDLMDLSTPGAFPPGLSLWLIDHGPWTPGNMGARWTWEGINNSNTAALFILE